MSVTLAIYSGRRDPEWSVPSSNPKFDEIQRLLEDARTRGFTYDSKYMPSRLGYKGFLVKEAEKKKLELIIGRETVQLQQLLLESMPDDFMSEQTRKLVLKEISAANIRAEVDQQE